VEEHLCREPIRRSTPRPSYQQKLAWALEDNLRLLTGEGYLAPLRAIPRLIEELHAAGVAGIVRPACPAVTGWCASTSRSAACGSAGPASRTRGPGSAHVAELAASPSPAMTRVGRCAPTASSLTRRTWRPAPTAGAAAGSSGGPRTGRCAPAASRCLTLPTCSICGQATPCGISRATGQPWCPACQRRTAACSACGRVAAIASGTLADPLCAGCTPPPAWADCPVCSDPGHPSPGQCARCLIDRRLDKLMGPTAGSLPPGCRPSAGSSPPPSTPARRCSG
jgi:hypothetical protein